MGIGPDLERLKMRFKILLAPTLLATLTLAVASSNAFADGHTLAISCTGDRSGTCAVVGSGSENVHWEGKNVTVNPTGSTTATYACPQSLNAEGVIGFYADDKKNAGTAIYITACPLPSAPG